MDALYPLESRLHPSESIRDVRIVPAREFRCVPWNNGGGTTRDIDILADAGGVAARLSLAAIERDGPFSDFAGYDRTLVLVSGAGVTLAFDDGGSARLDRIGEPYAFDGGRTVVAHLPAGPVHAFNVMTRRDLLRHRVTVGALPTPFEIRAPVLVRYVFVLAGSIAATGAIAAGEIAAGDALRVAGDALRVAGPGPVACRSTMPETTVIVTDVERAL